MNRKNRNNQVTHLVILALFAAIVILLGVSSVGLINLPVIRATLLHIPVIIGSVVMGPKKGAFLGFVFGMTSFITNTVAPNLTSFTFSPFIPLPGLQQGSPLAVVICFLPRILVGVVPYFIVKGIEKLAGEAAKKPGVRGAATSIAAFAGSFTNTILVMGMIYLFFKDYYAIQKDIPVEAVLGTILGIVGTYGIPEAISAVIITTPVVFALDKAGIRVIESKKKTKR